jgi:pimeloyl-ACP methyl ester carboxylesterase
MRLILLALVVLASACDSDAVDSRPPPELRDAQCPYEEEGVRCAYLDVPAKHSDPASGTLSLFITIIQAERASNARAPVVALAGGPGGTEAGAGWPGHPLREHHDIVLIDQRGAGLSEPSLHCGELAGLSFVGESIDDPVRRDVYRDAARACRNRFLERGVDLSVFNTEESAADVDDLRRALGVEQLNLYAGSYLQER